VVFLVIVGLCRRRADGRHDREELQGLSPKHRDGLHVAVRLRVSDLSREIERGRLAAVRTAASPRKALF